MNILYNLVRFVTAWGSLLRERMPVLDFLPFVFETLEPVSESLSARIDAQLHSSCKHREREAEETERSQEAKENLFAGEDNKRRQKLGGGEDD